ncbi:hypothetical protein PRIC2_009429 [Phytophthora ramorum]
MKVVLWLLALGGVVAQLPPDSGDSIPSSASGSKPNSASNSASSSSSGSSGSAGSWSENPWTTPGRPSGSGSYGDAGYSGGSNVGGSGSGWVDWDGSNGWDPSTELWHFRPSWNWDSPSPPEGTMYVENWGNPPTPEIPSRQSFNFGADKGVSLVGATAEGGRADCGGRDWCVHLTFHSSYGVLSDFDAFVLDRYDSAERLYGDGFWYAREGKEGPPKVFAPLVLGGFSPEEKAVMGNISSWRVEEMARRFNDTRTTTWTLYPDSDEMDVILSFKQLYTLLPGYPDGNMTQHALNSEVISEWGAGDQVLLRVIAKRGGGGATSAVMPRVLNFTGSQLFHVDSYSSIEYSQEDGNLTAAANGMTLDVVFGRRRYGSGLPWNPARPSDACDACNQQVMNHPMLARCLHGRVPESIFQDIYEQAANEQMSWDGGEWSVGETGAPSHLSYYLNDVVDACFGLRWLLNGKADGGSWSSDWAGFPGDGDRRSSSGSGDVRSGFGDAGYRGSEPGSGSNGDYNKYNDGSSFREPVYRYDDSGSRWSSWGYKDVGSASKYADAGSRWSSAGSAGDPNAGDWPSVRDLFAALSIARETDSGIQCFVESRCPVGNRNFAEAAGRMVVLEHEHALVRVNFTDPSYRFYMWMELEGLGSEGQFTTPELSSDHSPEEIADLVAGAVPNASDYNLAVDVRIFNNSDVIDWVNTFNEWMKDYHNSGGSASEASAAWSSYSASASAGSSLQFPPAGEDSMNGFYPNAESNSASLDGSSPNVGEGSDGSDWSFSDMIPVPEPQFTVEISLRNVSVVPNILDVYMVSDESMGSTPANMSWDARGSELRFQLSPLNLSTFEYVPPPSYVNLTWNEDIPEYPDPYRNASDWGDGFWSICTDCTDAYNACDNSTSCSIGVRSFLQEALSPSRFGVNESLSKVQLNDRRRWDVDIAPRLRQSASFFTVEGYELFVNLMVCVFNYACNLDLPRQAYSYSSGEYVSAQPTRLEIEPARSVFAVPSRMDGGENIVMKYRGKESLFEWDKMTNYFDALQSFIANVMNEYNADESLWTRSLSQNSSLKVEEMSRYYVAGYRVLGVEFGNDYFTEAEMPRLRPVSNDTYDEIESSHWKALITAYRNDVDETLSDSYPVVTWRKLMNWLYELGWDRNYGSGNLTAEDIPICHQCMDSWTQCFSDDSCAYEMRQGILAPLWNDLHHYNTRSSIDVSAQFAAWRESADPHVYAKVLQFFSCLDRESCPVGYAMSPDPAAPLVPVTTKLVSHFVLKLPLGKKVSANVEGYSFDFEPQAPATSGLENWLYATTNYESKVEIEASTGGDWVRYDITYYPAVAVIPTFFLTEDGSPFEPQAPTVLMSFQLSSNLVQYGQTVSAELLYYWTNLYSGSTNIFSYSGDIFSGTPVCHGCPECWEAVTRCQNNMDCTISAREVLIPRLRSATFPLWTGTEDDGQTLVNITLTPTLLSLKDEAFQSQEGWHAFSHLLYALSLCACEVCFGQSTSNGTYLEPTRVHIDSEPVEVSVRLYANTKLDVWFDGNRYSYSPPTTGQGSDTTNDFIRWFTPIANSEPFYVVVEPWFQETDALSGATILRMKLYEMYDEASNNQPLVNPNWIPTFSITTDDVSADPPAEAVVTPWKVTLQSVGRYPPFDRLLDLLEYGAVSAETPSSGTSSSDTSSSGTSSSTGDECTKCEGLRQDCFDDTECQSAVSNRLIPNLKYMSSMEGTAGWYSDMSTKVLGAFYEIPSLGAKQKLLQLLTCSATKWITSTTGQEGASCVQQLVDTDSPGVTANLEITRAMSVFPINIGQQTKVDTPTGTTLYYTDNGIAAELVAFMDNQVFGGYTSSGVRTQVTADPNLGTYTVIYDGLTTESAPTIESQTSSSAIQFQFVSSVSDMLSVFSPWIVWLTPNQN